MVNKISLPYICRQELEKSVTMNRMVHHGSVSCLRKIDFVIEFGEILIKPRIEMLSK